jgi:hypothetical protein
VLIISYAKLQSLTTDLLEISNTIIHRWHDSTDVHHGGEAVCDIGTFTVSEVHMAI